MSGPALFGVARVSSAPLLSAVPNTGLVPRHVAIIMDGNGRWAKAGTAARRGHKAGVEAVRRVTRAARAMGIEALTLYAFSSENWRRPEEEVGALMGLLRCSSAATLANWSKRMSGCASSATIAVRARSRRAGRRCGRQDRGQHRPGAGDRPQLRIAGQLVAAAQTLAARGGGGGRSTLHRSRPSISRRSCRPRTCRARPRHLARRASSGCRTSCCGRRPMPSCCSSRPCGPISTATRWPMR